MEAKADDEDEVFTLLTGSTPNIVNCHWMFIINESLKRIYSLKTFDFDLVGEMRRTHEGEKEKGVLV